MTKWYLDPEQRKQFKRDYRRKTQHDPAYIETFAHVGDYCGVGWDIVPQIGKSEEQIAWEKAQKKLPKKEQSSPEARWFDDNFAIVQMSRPIKRDMYGRPSDEQELREALDTPEVFEVPEGHKLCLGPCGDVKPFEKFDKKTDAKDGHQSWCQNCNRERLARYQWEKREIERLMLIEQGKYRRPGRPSQVA